jgi:hypothetical protein
VDRALRHLREEKERIGAALLDLEGHTGYRLLDGGTLTGETARRQAEVRSRTANLWTLFDLYGRTLQEAEDLRARHPKPGGDQLSRLTWLLGGPSVELPAEEVPLERRTLLAPKAEALSLESVVQRMNPLYEQVARDVAALDGLWSALLARLDEVDATRRSVAELVEALGAPEPEYDRAAESLEALARTVRSDPLALARDGRADTTGLDAVAKEFAALKERLAEAARFRQGFDERMGRVRDAVGLVRDAEDEVRHARAEVQAKIASPALPDPAGRASALEDRLAALPVLRDRRRWGDLADRATDLERAARAALDQARADLQLINGLLERREELRGRLQAYRAKAARLGHAEDAELTGMYEEAHAVLWTSPCDLRRATVLLSGYQQAISVRTKGPGR